MDTATNEEFTAKDLGVAVAKDVGLAAAQVVAAYGLLLGIGYTYVKVSEFRARRAAKKNQTEK